MDLPVKCIMDSPSWSFQGWGWMTIQSFNVWSTVKGQPYLRTRHLLTLSTWERKNTWEHMAGEKCACFVRSVMQLLLVAGVGRWRMCFLINGRFHHQHHHSRAASSLGSCYLLGDDGLQAQFISRVPWRMTDCGGLSTGWKRVPCIL